MVVIQLGGQFLLYPSAFVGILVNELINPLPFENLKRTSITEEASFSEVFGDNVLAQPLNANSTQSFSTQNSG